MTTDPPTGRVADPAVRPALVPVEGGVREVEVDGRLSLYRRDADRVLVLNETAGDVWRLADGTLGEDEIVELLGQAYGLEPEVIRDDVRTTLERLVHEGFLALDLR